MDEMKLNVSTKFMRKAISTIISKIIKKKLGYKVDLQLNELSFDIIDGEVHLHTNVDAKLDKEEFNKIINLAMKGES